MPDQPSPGPIIILAGAAIVVLGLLVWSGALAWFGRLPGDVKIERPGFRFYAPITSMILISVALSAALAAFRWFGRR